MSVTSPVSTTSMTTKQLAALYGMSRPTMTSRLNQYKHIIGERMGYLWSPEQVKQIFELMGKPDASR